MQSEVADNAADLRLFAPSPKGRSVFTSTASAFKMVRRGTPHRAFCDGSRQAQGGNACVCSAGWKRGEESSLRQPRLCGPRIVCVIGFSLSKLTILGDWPGWSGRKDERIVAMRVVNGREGWIGFRLNILGIRVSEAGYCQLVGKNEGRWVTLGPWRNLPVQVPRTAEELSEAASDPLRLTAFQYTSEHPDTDLPELLAKTKTFDSALLDDVGATSAP